MAKGFTHLVGTRFGRWFVRNTTRLLKKQGGRLRKVPYCDCICDCGNERLVNVYHLLRGISRSCGCLNLELVRERAKTTPPPFIKFSGVRFGRLVATSFYRKEMAKQTRTFAICECDCGNTKDIELSVLKAGHTRSCGCLQRESRQTHCQSKHPMYKTWEGMMSRCYNQHNERFEDYGGRGIKVCERWHNPSRFFADCLPLGWHKGLSIDRKDNDGDYEPGNIRIANASIQANNRRSNHLVTYKGKTLNISQWAKELGINRTAISARINSGTSMEDVLNEFGLAYAVIPLPLFEYAESS